MVSLSRLPFVTASTLLLYIALAIGLQCFVAVVVAAFRSQKQTPQLPSPAVASVVSTGAWQGTRAFRVEGRAFEDAAKTQCSFYLRPQDGLALPPFKPGQFLTFVLDVPAAEGSDAKRVTRCYSLSDRPDPQTYRVTIKRVPAPPDAPGVPAGVSSNYFHDVVLEGNVLSLRAPSGHFYLDAQSQQPIVLIGGGIGITPMMSMLRWCLEHQPQRQVHLYYGLRNSAEHAYKQTLEALAKDAGNVHLHVVYSKPLAHDVKGVDYQHCGHANVALLQTTLPHGPHQFYICGPAAMMESLVPALAHWGVPNADIHFEAFGPASVRLPAAPDAVDAPALPGSAEVRFERSGRTLQWTGKEFSLLDFAEAHGVEVESGCRSGGCGSCVTTVRSGMVDYDTPPDYDLQAGQCLLCVGKPRGPLVLEA